MNDNGIATSRVDGELDFTDDEDDLVADAPEEKRRKIENVRAWIKDLSDSINHRSFNENDLLGTFKRDWCAAIPDREYLLKKHGFKDLDGNCVNARGYLIDDHTGDVRSRYTFEVMFSNFELVGSVDAPGEELPLPYRLERHNFNPHHCMGNFDYDINGKPYIDNLIDEKNG
jgi:hypothetical protein